MTLNIFKLWKKDLSNLYDVSRYNSKPTKTQIKIKALELLESQLVSLKDDPACSLEEVIERLNLFEETGWFIKRARILCAFDYTYGMLKDNQKLDSSLIPIKLSNSSKLRLFGLGWIIILLIYGLTLLFK